MDRGTVTTLEGNCNGGGQKSQRKYAFFSAWDVDEHMAPPTAARSEASPHLCRGGGGDYMYGAATGAGAPPAGGGTGDMSIVTCTSCLYGIDEALGGTDGALASSSGLLLT